VCLFAPRRKHLRHKYQAVSVFHRRFHLVARDAVQSCKRSSSELKNKKRKQPAREKAPPPHGFGEHARDYGRKITELLLISWGDKGTHAQCGGGEWWGGSTCLHNHVVLCCGSAARCSSVLGVAVPVQCVWQRSHRHAAQMIMVPAPPLIPCPSAPHGLTPYARDQVSHTESYTG
jgi:hypothetical protein